MIEVSSGKEITQIQHNQNISEIVFSPDGRFIVTMNGEGGVKVNLYQSKDIVIKSCEVVERNLSLNEWKRFLGGKTPYNITCPGKYVPQDAQNELDRIQQQRHLTYLEIALVVIVLTIFAWRYFSKKEQ